MGWVESHGGAYEITPTGVDGINEVYIVLPHANDPSQTRNTDPIKTVYDPAFFSDDQMIDMARQAGSQVYRDVERGALPIDDDGNARTQVVVNKITFEVRINRDENTGRPLVGSVYPVN